MKTIRHSPTPESDNDQVACQSVYHNDGHHGLSHAAKGVASHQGMDATVRRKNNFIASLHQPFQNRRAVRIMWLLAGGSIACLALPVSPATGLLAGALIALFSGDMMHEWTGRVASWSLKTAVVALGASMPLDLVWRTGMDGFGYTLTGLTVTLSLGLWLGYRTRLSSDLTRFSAPEAKSSNGR